MHRKFLIVLLILSILSFCSKNPERSFLILRDTIKLELTDQSALAGVSEIIVTDSSFIILDNSSHFVHEFCNTGKYIRTFGGHGQGPGEYQQPRFIEVDNSGNVIVSDNMSMILNVYKSDGTFVRDLNINNEFGWSDDLKIDRDGNMLQLANFNGIHLLKKYKSPYLERIYSTSLSDEKTGAVVRHFRGFTGFTYNPVNNNVYYINPNGFQIQEVDSETGNIVKSFGIKPPNYRLLNGKYLKKGEISDTRALSRILRETTFVIGYSFQLLRNKYLFIGFLNNYIEPDKPWKEVTTWHLYDIESGEQLFTLSEDFDFNAQNIFASKDDKLYVYNRPDENDPEDCDGWIRSYSLNL